MAVELGGKHIACQIFFWSLDEDGAECFTGGKRSDPPSSSPGARCTDLAGKEGLTVDAQIL